MMATLRYLLWRADLNGPFSSLSPASSVSVTASAGMSKMTKMRAAKVCATWSMAEIVWKSTRCRRRRTAWLAGFAFCGNAEERMSEGVEARLSMPPGLNIETRFAAAGEALPDSSFELRRKRVATEPTMDAVTATSPSDPPDLAEPPSAASPVRSFEIRRKRAPTLRAEAASPTLDMLSASGPLAGSSNVFVCPSCPETRTCNAQWHFQRTA